MIKLCENKRAADLTASMIRKGREPHSIIICGEHGLGKRTIAKVVAAQLLCEEGSGTPCGKCRSCRLIEKDAHPDFITAKPSGSGNYKTDDIRAIVSDAVISPSEGKYKIYLIPDMDRSVQTLPQLQNVLLKLIEEPPDTAVIILTARSKEVFLDTIISRTVHLQAEEVAPAAAQAWLIENGVSAELAEEAVRRCGGNIGQCLEYSQNEDLRNIAAIAERASAAIAENNEYELLTAISECEAKKDSLIKLFTFMQRIVRDSCRIRAGAEQSRIFSQKVCRSMSMSHSALRLADLYDILGDFRYRVSANCSIAMLINALPAKIFS